MVAHTCNSNTQGSKSRRITSRSRASRDIKQNLVFKKPPKNKQKRGMVVMVGPGEMIPLLKWLLKILRT